MLPTNTIPEEATKKSLKLDGVGFQSVHSAVLAADTNIIVIPLNWKPDLLIIVARMTIGFIWVYTSAQRGANSYRTNSGTIKIPVRQIDTLTIETVGATGWWSVYATRDLPDFDIES